MTKLNVKNYKTVTIEAATTGWILKVKGEPTEIFVRWDALVRKLETLLTNSSTAREA